MGMNNRKQKIISIFLGVLFLCSINVCAYADSKGVIKSASEYDYPPFCIVSKDGKADGFSVELLRASLSAVDLDVEFKTGPWEQLKIELSEGTIQVLPLVGRTPEREAIYDFTFPYLSLHGAIFVRKGDARIKTVGDLADKTVVVMRGDNAEEFVLRKKISSHIVAVDTYTEAMQLLNAGKYDAVIAQHLMGIQLLNKMGMKTVVPLDFVIHDFKQDFCFAVRKWDNKLLSLLNEGLSIVIANGTFDQLHEKWFGPLLDRPISFKDIFKYLLVVFIPFAVISVLLLIVLLRREVKNKTKILRQEIEVRKRTEEKLNLYTAELKRSNEELQQFAYIASHDLQEPLRMIASYLQLIEKRYKGKLDKDADEFIAFAVDGALRLQEMIIGLLNYSRVGTKVISFQEVNTSEVLATAILNLKTSIEDSGARVTADRLPVVKADAGQLTQIFQNLISNSLKFRSKEIPRIHISAEKKGEEWVYSVQDNGIGISPEYRDRIFKIFQRLHGRESPGIGIGLSLCRRIIEKHGGRIWFESEAGNGTTFYFTIPVTPV
jgi:signal transduction histidine kinase